MSEAARELVGRTLGGRFRITGFLGEGAMASVYRAEQDGEPREVAVKIMHPELLRDVTFAKRFAREAKAAAKIVHRNTARILEHGADGDLLYLAMELLVGSDLFDTLALRKRLPEARAARIVAQICGALEAAHAHAIVHRDLKPENVFLTSDPDDPDADLVKVLDFGIAKILERERSADDAPPSSEPMSAPPSSVLTRVGTIVGTPEYMSPEQANGAPIDARSDLWACGVLLFHMITGRPPFTGGAPIEVMIQISNSAPPLPSSLQPGIHPILEQIILKALEKRPDARHESARELREALLAVLPELGTSKRAPAASVPPSNPSLPGIPGPVAIAIDGRPRAEGDEPPATMRSTAGDAAKSKTIEIEERTAPAQAAKASPDSGDVDRVLGMLTEAKSEPARGPREVAPTPAVGMPIVPKTAAAAAIEIVERTLPTPPSEAAKAPEETAGEAQDAGEPEKARAAAERGARTPESRSSALFTATTGDGSPRWVWLVAAAVAIAILWALAR